MKIAVIAGGASFHAKRRKYFPRDMFDVIIGVNDAAIHMRSHYCVTMDRRWLENRYEEASPLSNIYYRECIAKNVKPGPRHTAFKNNNAPGPMSDDDDTLNGNNSGACALNLAYHYGHGEVYLFGYDMQPGPAGERHWWSDYPWNPIGTKDGTLEKWAGNFADAAAQFKATGMPVYNVSDHTLIKDFPILSFEDLTL